MSPSGFSFLCAPYVPCEAVRKCHPGSHSAEKSAARPHDAREIKTVIAADSQAKGPFGRSRVRFRYGASAVTMHPATVRVEGVEA